MANKYRHIFLRDIASKRSFTSISSRASELRIPQRDRAGHSQFLAGKLNAAWQEAESEQAVIHAAREGVYIEFKSDPDSDLITKSLEDFRSKKVRLLNVRTEKENEKEVIYATVYVANDRKKFFLEKIHEYAEKDTKSGKPKNLTLINSISDIRKALLIESFWQDDKHLIPATDKVWCEVWLSNHSDEVNDRFNKLLTDLQIEEAKGLIHFPERTVRLVYADKNLLEKITSFSDDIAEYRRAKESAAFWFEINNKEQAEWVEECLKRVNVDKDSKISVCILDTGINNGHPLIKPVLNNQDRHAVDPTWGVEDHDGHGTLMAGLVSYGNLQECIESRRPINLSHLLESVVVLPPKPRTTKQELWGYVTSQAISRAEVQAPGRKRVVCMAITSVDTRDRGRPSSWSGKLDQLAMGGSDDEKRLIIVSAGNLEDIQSLPKYPDAQITESSHDPAQAWNALSVGAFTELITINDPSLRGYAAIAPAQGLSPFTTTSLTWENKWPIKPEILMEGGNAASDGSNFSTECDDLSILSTNHQPTISHFRNFSMTSAATAQASWFAAKLLSMYPDFWPETIRALMVHSAEWTERMKTQFLRDQSKTSYGQLLRICGYGVPDLSRALYSASNVLTLVTQAELQPFDKKENNQGYKTNEMHLYDLPWPKDVLLNLPHNVKVQMRVTLSYFIEPGPGEIGWKDRYRYPSHNLRFDVKSPSETIDIFLKRINAAARDEDEGHPGTSGISDHWVIGSRGRDKGSIHSDIWNGTAAELATSGVIAVYPVVGWWRERAYLGHWNQKCRYSLIVTISTPEQNVDIYTPVANKVGIATPVAI